MSRKGLRSTPKVFNASYKPARKHNWQLYKSLLPVIYLFGIVVAFLLIARIPIFIIENIQVSGTDKQEIIEEINNLKGQSLFSRTINKKENQIINEQLMVKNVNCRRGIPSTLRCAVTVRTPSVIWQSTGVQYLVDESGVAYSLALELPEIQRQNLIIVEDKRMVAVEIGNTVSNKDIIDSISRARNALRDGGYVVGAIVVDELFYNFTVNLISTNNALPFTAFSPLPVYITTTYSIESQVKALGEILKTSGGLITSYIDLRVQGYAYYK